MRYSTRTSMSLGSCRALSSSAARLTRSSCFWAGSSGAKGSKQRPPQLMKVRKPVLAVSSYAVTAGTYSIIAPSRSPAPKDATPWPRLT